MKLISGVIVVFLISLSISGSDAYFGTKREVRALNDISASIDDNLAIIKKLSDLCDFIKDLEDDDASSGYNCYKNAITLICTYLNNMASFLKTMKQYSQLTDIKTDEVIATVTTIVDQLGNTAAIVQSIKDAIALGGTSWTTELSCVTDADFAIINGSLKTIVGALLVICNEKSTADSLEQADAKLFSSLEDLKVQLAKFSSCYTYLQNLYDFIQARLAEYEATKADLDSIIDLITTTYKFIYTQDGARITSKNTYCIQGFIVEAKTKSGFSADIMTYDGNNLILAGNTYDFKTKFLNLVLQDPSLFETNMIQNLAALIAKLQAMRDKIDAAGFSLIIKFFNLSKGDSLLRIWNCILSNQVQQEFEDYISADFDSLKSLLALKYFSVTVFSNALAAEFDAMCTRVATQIYQANAFADVAILMDTNAKNGANDPTAPTFSSETDYFKAISQFDIVGTDAMLMDFISKLTCPQRYRQ